MFHPGTTRLIACWSSLNAGRVPARAQFDPTVVADLLPLVFMLGRDGDRLAFRIAGEALRDLFGRPLKGADVFELFSAPARAVARRAALDSIRDGAPMVLVCVGQTDAGALVSLEILLAPLLGKDGTADRLIGLIQPTTSAFLLEGRPVTEIVVRMAASAGSLAPRPTLRLAAIDGKRLA